MHNLGEDVDIDLVNSLLNSCEIEFNELICSIDNFKEKYPCIKVVGEICGYDIDYSMVLK